MAEVTFKGVKKAYGPVTVIPNLDLDIRDHEFMVLASCSYLGLNHHPKILQGIIDALAWIGISADDLNKALGRVPEHSVISDGQLVVRSNNEGVPFVLADPSAAVSQDIARVATELMGAARTAVGAGRQ